MAYVNALVSRECDPACIELVEVAIAECVKPIVYDGVEHPEETAVDVSVAYAQLDTFMALKVEIDTEDLPAKGWLITESGLCVRATSELAVGKLKTVRRRQLTDSRWNAHSFAQGKEVHDRFVEHPIWNAARNLGWRRSGMDSHKQLGVLVAKAEGAWYASYTQET